MQDVSRIDLMPRTALKVGLSYNIPNITEVGVAMSDDTALTDARLHAASLLSLSLNGDNADALMDNNGSHKVAGRREKAGLVRTHTLRVPIETGFKEVRDRDNSLQQTEFHIILTTCDGTRYLAYGLPNTSQFTIDEQMGQSAQMTVQAVVQSVSGFIKILG